jgi:hypothetical protein
MKDVELFVLHDAGEETEPSEREWPKCDVIVGNPPFIGNKRLRTELGDAYTNAVFDTFGDRLPATSDFCCYWFEKARALVAGSKCQRAGLLATTGSKQVGSRRAFERIKDSGKIIFAISDRDWFDSGTAIRICMVGFSRKDATATPILDGREVTEISANLSAGLDLTGKKVLRANEGFCFMGSTKVGDFDIEETTALPLLALPNVVGKPNSDVLRLFRNGSDIVRADSKRWVIDYGVTTPLEVAAGYEGPVKHLEKFVRPFREKNNRAHYREKWWIHAEARPGFRAATARMSRYLGTARVAKHRLFVWLDSEWTEARTLEFPGSVNGPWARYVDPKTVNAKTGVGTVRYPRLEPRDADCAAKLKKRTLTNLYNERPAWLDLAHKKLDATVAAAYGWPADLNDEQILEKLLALNLERFAEEETTAKVKKPKTSREKLADELL